MEINQNLRRILLLMLAVFILGAGVSFIKHHLSSGWTAERIQNVKDGCLQQNGTQEFCDCYANEISNRISKDKFLEMTKNMNKSEAELKKAKEFAESVVEHCSEFRK